MKQRIARAILVGLGCALAMAGCRSSPQREAAPVPSASSRPSHGNRENPFLLSQWEYETRDETGTPLTRGMLTLRAPIKPTIRFYGSWHATYVGPPELRDAIGPQLDGIKLMGTLHEDGRFVVELNPSRKDAYVVLIGTLDAEQSAYSGQWTYGTLAGVVKQGTFEAKRLP